jgi:hypothetical protein
MNEIAGVKEECNVSTVPVYTVSAEYSTIVPDERDRRCEGGC